jgi:hypothetical protein
MVGAGYSWLVANVIYFLFWVPLVHKRLAPGLHAKWLLHDVGAPAVVATVFASIIGVVITWPENRMLVGIEIGVVSLVLLTLALFSSRDVRTRALGLNTAG